MVTEHHKLGQQILACSRYMDSGSSGILRKTQMPHEEMR